MAAEYSFTANEHTILRYQDGAYIPDDPANRDYQEYLAYVDAGGVTDPYVPPPEAEPQPLTLEAQPAGLMDAATMSSVKVFVHEELAPLTESIAELERRVLALEIGQGPQPSLPA